jgi:hypothetical protein
MSFHIVFPSCSFVQLFFAVVAVVVAVVVDDVVAVVAAPFLFFLITFLCVFAVAAAVVVIGMLVIVAAAVSSCFPFHSFVPLFFSVAAVFADAAVVACVCCGYFCSIIALFMLC